MTNCLQKFRMNNKCLISVCCIFKLDYEAQVKTGNFISKSAWMENKKGFMRDYENEKQNCEIRKIICFRKNTVEFFFLKKRFELINLHEAKSLPICLAALCS